MLKLFREIFDDGLTRAAGILFVFIVLLTIFNTYSDLPEKYPLLGAFTFLTVPVLFIVGAIVFVRAMLRANTANGKTGGGQE